MAGGSILQRVDENLTYDYLHSSEDNLWSLLYLTGYLTKAQTTIDTDELPPGMMELKIPNAEIKEIFETTVVRWFDESAKTWNRKTLFDAIWSGDCDRITQELTALLRRTISYHDYREDFYHAFLAGIFTGAGYMVDSNKEHGEGRSDVVLYDSINGRVAVFEAKYTKALENLSSACDSALQQMNEKLYAKEYEDDYDQIFCYGISFLETLSGKGTVKDLFSAEKFSLQHAQVSIKNVKSTILFFQISLVYNRILTSDVFRSLDLLSLSCFILLFRYSIRNYTS